MRPGAAGAELGCPTYAQAVFGLALASMSLGGAVWMIATLVLTPLLTRGDSALRKGDPAPVAAICGAATIHLLSLSILVGMRGTWLVGVIPPDIVQTIQLYILPTVLGAVVGAVMVQAIVSQRNARAAVIALAVSLVVVFVLPVFIPGFALFSTAVAVISTAVLAWVLRDRKEIGAPEDVTAETELPEGPVY